MTLLYDLLGDPPFKWFVYMFFHFRFLFLNHMEYYRVPTSLQLEYYRVVHLVTVGILSSHPPRYSWNIIEHPPRYSWNIIEHPPRYSWIIIELVTRYRELQRGESYPQNQ